MLFGLTGLLSSIGFDSVRRSPPFSQSVNLRRFFSGPIAAAYSNLVPLSSSLDQKPPKDFVSNDTVRSALDSAFDWWFNRDFNVTACLDNGGVSGGACPCGTPGLWNPNWFANVSQDSSCVSCSPGSYSRSTGRSFLYLSLPAKLVCFTTTPFQPSREPLAPGLEIEVMFLSISLYMASGTSTAQCPP